MTTALGWRLQKIRETDFCRDEDGCLGGGRGGGVGECGMFADEGGEGSRKAATHDPAEGYPRSLLVLVIMYLKTTCQ